MKDNCLRCRCEMENPECNWDPICASCEKQTKKEAVMWGILAAVIFIFLLIAREIQA